MGSLLSGALSAVTGALGGIWGYVAAGALSAIVAGAGVGWTVHRLDQATIAQIQLADSQAALAATQKAAALQKAQDDISLKAAVADAQSQAKIVTQTVTVTKEIPAHVSDASHCITYGLVRVLNAAATGADPDAVPASPGQSDDACAPVSWRDFAGDIVADYEAGRQNAQQLDDLEDWVRAQAKAAP